MSFIVKKCSSQFRSVLDKARFFAVQSGEGLSNFHLVKALLEAKGSVAYELLLKLGVAKERQNSDDGETDKKNKNKQQILTAEMFVGMPRLMRKTVRQAVMLAALRGHSFVGTEHLLLGLLEVDRKALTSSLKGKEVSLDKIKTQAEVILRNTERFGDIISGFNPSQFSSKFGEISSESGSISSDISKGQGGGFGAGGRATPLRQSKKTRVNTEESDGMLGYFAIELTDKQAQTRINPVIGREREIERVIQILARRDKSNPVLIGDPGVGKTAIVEGLAKRIYEGDVPDFLQGKRIFSLDLPGMLAGTMYRGEFESRLKQVMDEIIQDTNIILFIDELHTIVGAGSAAGSLDAANILKPALARGSIRMIGATTHEEYKKNIEPDLAFERRLQPVLVREPSIKETTAILKGIKSAYEKHHRVLIEDDAIECAAKFSVRYLPERFLPDKAIDLIDEAAARMTASAKPGSKFKVLCDLQKQLRQVLESKRKAVEQENFPKALSLKQKEREIYESINTLEAQPIQDNEQMERITQNDIVNLVAQVSGVPVADLVGSDKTDLKHLEAKLNRRIIGQKEAIRALVEAVKRSKMGLSSADRPLGSFMFLGPTGVGKTETAKTLAEVVYHDPKALIRFDMSEFAESFSVSRLLGAPAGYIGYREGGQLTEMVRRHPYSVVLFDEIEKANREIFNVLLQVLEDGCVTDASGKQVSFRNTIIIMTSNIGLADFNKSASLGFSENKGLKNSDKLFDETQTQVMKSLRKSFRPEFLNRLDKMIVFRPLEKDSLRKIVSFELNSVVERGLERGLNINFDKSLLDHLTGQSVKPNGGARAIRRTVQNSLIAPLVEYLLENDGIKKVHVELKNNKIIFKNITSPEKN